MPTSATVSDSETIGPQDDLRRALSRLLGNSTGSLSVVDKDGQVLGQITFADIRAAITEDGSAVQVA